MPSRPILPQPLDLLVQNVARRLDAPANLVRAIVLVESSGDVHAWNPEPRYHYLWDCAKNKPFRALSASEADTEIPPLDFTAQIGDRDAEWWGQQASWGPMQVMGAVAREKGFLKHFPALCDGYEGVWYGCLHLMALAERWLAAEFAWRGVVAAYNYGHIQLVGAKFANQVYVDKVERAGGFVDL